MNEKQIEELAKELLNPICKDMGFMYPNEQKEANIIAKNVAQALPQILAEMGLEIVETKELERLKGVLSVCYPETYKERYGEHPAPCPECGGWGHPHGFSDEKNATVCPECGGTKTTIEHFGGGSLVCPTCKGKGEA